VPNQFGDVFDAGGPLVKSFNLWDRQTLINKYNADFYHGEPTKSTLALCTNRPGLENPRNKPAGKCTVVASSWVLAVVAGRSGRAKASTEARMVRKERMRCP
jgi:hypothetical protein